MAGGVVMVVLLAAGAATAQRLASHPEAPAVPSPAASVPVPTCAQPPCVDGSALDGRVNIFVSRPGFRGLVRRWCALRAGMTREHVRDAIHRTKGIIAEYGQPSARVDAWNVAISRGGTMTEGVAVDVRFEAVYNGAGRVLGLSHRSRAGAASARCSR
jgi:hypothetical protein